MKLEIGGMSINIPDWCCWLSMDKDGAWHGWANQPIASFADDKWTANPRDAKIRPEQGPVMVHLGPRDNPCWHEALILLKETR